MKEEGNIFCLPDASRETEEKEGWKRNVDSPTFMRLNILLSTVLLIVGLYDHSVAFTVTLFHTRFTYNGLYSY